MRDIDGGHADGQEQVSRASADVTKSTLLLSSANVREN